MRFRLGRALAVALLPVLVLGLLQATAAFRRDAEERRASLVLAAEHAAGLARARLESASVLLEALAPDTIGVQCAPRLRAVRDRLTGYENLIRFSRSGRVSCAADTVPPDAERVNTELKPDVVLCDLHLPGLSGLEITERINRSDLPTRVIIVSVLEDGPLPKRLLEAGAAGYIGKAGDAVELLRAVRDVARGKRYLGSNVAQNLALSSMDGASCPFDALSPRELEVAMLLVQGLRQEDIAKRLSLSAKTVNTHKSRLFEKMSITDTISLARLATQYGLVDPAHSI